MIGYSRESKRLRQHALRFISEVIDKIETEIFSGKSGWDTITAGELLILLRKEVTELKRELGRCVRVNDRAIEEAVDVAAFALFFAAREYEKE